MEHIIDTPTLRNSLTEAIATRLTQETVGELEDANRIFGAKNETGGIPIVVTPIRAGKTNKVAMFFGTMMAFIGLFLSQIPGLSAIIKPMIFSGFGMVTFWPIMLGLLAYGLYPLIVIKIPSGVFALMTKYGRYVGIYEAGRHFLPPWYKVAYMVTRQSTAYNAPVKDCPTADNVMIKIDLLLVFNVEDPERFVYKLGAEKFGDLLSSSAEEGIRGLVRSTAHDCAYELRGRGASEMLSSLNEVFQNFGVVFTSANITNVVLPPELASALENQTVYEAKKKEQVKHQEYEEKVLQDKESLARQELDKRNERLAADANAKKDRELILKDAAEVQSMKEKRLAEIAAEKRANVMEIEARGENNAAEMKANALAVKARSEAEASNGLAHIRAHELELERIKVLGELATNGKVVIAGNNGDNLIAQITAATRANDTLTSLSLAATAELEEMPRAS